MPPGSSISLPGLLNQIEGKPVLPNKTCRRLETLNKYAGMKLDSHPRKKTAPVSTLGWVCTEGKHGQGLGCLNYRRLGIEMEEGHHSLHRLMRNDVRVLLDSSGMGGGGASVLIWR
ncbi:hypothetical protein RRG08_020096 [Elysia crispata]|uniref:Uncharacterized protein n=1 Tax=Elysia crispata TaxID=231223 RepID=A0AAE1DSY8_9GAST|nr:hypothetical protein RRG08_020096 [Elysia crispata]